MPLTDSEILAALYNNCDPAKPANARFYVDCADVRGGAVFAQKFCNELSQTNGRLKALFTGHIGCGKSSELQHLADKMSHHAPLPGQKRFFPVIVNMSEYLDEYDVTTTDILLAIVAELADALRKQVGITLSDSYLRKRWDEVKGYLLSDAEINEGEVSLGWGKAKVQRMRTDPAARRQVREKLLPQTRTLLDEINLAFVEARTALKKALLQDNGETYTDFVLILDNLEKIERLADNAQGFPSQRALFVEGAAQFTALDAHIVFTVPLALVRSEGGVLAQMYRKEPFILPMVKTEHRGPDHRPFEKGRDKLTELLNKRVPPGTSLANVFAPDALDFLIEYSAGHVRNLMMYAREATNFANGKLPIQRIHVQRAMAQTVQVLVPSLAREDWELLAMLELSENQEWENNSPAQRRLLENLCVMEYINGDDAGNPLADVAPWYAVNPILRVQRGFTTAVKALQQVPTEA
jgi:hypothetical protein